MVQTDQQAAQRAKEESRVMGRNPGKIETKRACDSCFWVTESQVLMDDAGGAGLFTGPEKNRRTRSEKSHDRPQEEEPWRRDAGLISHTHP